MKIKNLINNRAGFDRACQILLWKTAPEIVQTILKNIDGNHNLEGEANNG